MTQLNQEVIKQRVAVALAACDGCSLDDEHDRKHVAGVMLGVIDDLFVENLGVFEDDGLDGYDAYDCAIFATGLELELIPDGVE